ncbi:hypothetical protein RM779_22140 [Streptomyces sp. DSM 41886]|uniref:Transcriptional regulator LmrA/YxaF-like C-terminal domain-containing protein n=1 Tax=Streptomyces johnsoniae TaxID=3075532 RepID=A0ABU2S8H7_9ACTN|nr:hypothetical protein [Streptomyces sp. DSM 41886]MDT0445281.1 hypothetical protein [Streptomyces sp. DSM 41886]
MPPDTAAGLSVTLLSCLEGALVLCRAQQSVQPLHHVAEHLTALVHPHLPGPGPCPGPQ